MNFIHSNGTLGFVYTYQCFDKERKLKWELREENLIPNVGRDYFLNAALNGGTQYNTWYIGLYEADRTPVVADTMATLMADCQEITTYVSVGGARLELIDDPLSNGVWSNIGTVAEFTFNASKTVRGGFVCSNASQGSSAGLLLSAVKNSTAKGVDSGEILRVTAGLSLTTV
jgi:hypothetical protein